MLTSTVAEVGTGSPTVVAPDAQERFAEVVAADPATTWVGLTRRVELVFSEFQAAWASRDLARMRPLMSDALFATQTFWVEEYRRQGLRNVTEGASVTGIARAGVVRDAFFDAVTVRLYASSTDFTVRDIDGALVSGSRTDVRRYSEYWTLIRGRGAKGAPRLDASCPNCGAPLAVSMAGACRHRNAKVTSGQFDWVLSASSRMRSTRGDVGGTRSGAGDSTRPNALTSAL